jgi:hypothetical protein
MLDTVAPLGVQPERRALTRIQQGDRSRRLGATSQRLPNAVPATPAKLVS